MLIMLSTTEEFAYISIRFSSVHHFLIYCTYIRILLDREFPGGPVEKEMATHCSVLAWGIPGTGESDGLPSMGSHRVGHD